MSKNARTFLTALFFLAFAVTAPAVVLYTKGYRYDWRKTKVEETGILRIESVPTGAAIFLNGTPTNLTTPASLFRLLPEQYTVRLELPGRISWERTLEVKSGETTFASGIRLVSDGLPVMQTSLDARSAVFNTDGSRLVFFRDNGEWVEMGIADAMTGNEALLARFATGKYRDIRAEWSPEEDFIAFAATEDDESVLTFYRTAAPYEAISLDDAIPFSVSPLFHWTDEEGEVIVITDEPAMDRGLRVFLAPTVTYQGIGERATDIGILEDAAGDLRLLVDDTGARIGFADGTYLELTERADRILRIKDDRALLLDSARGKTLLVDTTQRKILASYDAARFSLPVGENGWNGLLLWSDYEISSVDAASGKRTVITRVGSRLRDVRGIPGLPIIAYFTDAGVTLIEREDTGGRSTYDLGRFSDIGGIGIDADGARLLFLGAIGNQRGIYTRGL